MIFQLGNFFNWGIFSIKQDLFFNFKMPKSKSMFSRVLRRFNPLIRPFSSVSRKADKVVEDPHLKKIAESSKNPVFCKNLYNKIELLEVCRTFSGRGMGIDGTAQLLVLLVLVLLRQLEDRPTYETTTPIIRCNLRSYSILVIIIR